MKFTSAFAVAASVLLAFCSPLAQAQSLKGSVKNAAAADQSSHRRAEVSVEELVDAVDTLEEAAAELEEDYYMFETVADLYVENLGDMTRDEQTYFGDAVTFAFIAATQGNGIDHVATHLYAIADDDDEQDDHKNRKLSGKQVARARLTSGRRGRNCPGVVCCRCRRLQETDEQATVAKMESKLRETLVASHFEAFHAIGDVTIVLIKDDY